MEKQLSQNLFIENKTDWYDYNERDEKNWDYKKVSNFWKTLKQQKIDKNDFDFTNFVFPSFKNEALNNLSKEDNKEINNYWIYNLNKEFRDHEINFQDVIFEGITSFNHIVFDGYVYFFNCIFKDDFTMNHCIFNKRVIFSNCVFKGNVTFVNTTFTKDSSFIGLNFEKNTTINYCNFDQFTFFMNVKFEEKTFIRNTGFYEGCDFIDLKFSEKFRTEFENFASLDLNKITRNEYNIYEKLSYHVSSLNNFKTYYKNDEKHFVEILKLYHLLEVENESNNIIKYLKKIPKSRMIRILHFIKTDNDKINNSRINFNNINFTNKVVLRRLNLSNSIFSRSDILDVNFRECNWGTNNRIIFENENTDYIQLEETYRQLKRNFYSNKNWELSGFAYISEMEMRKKRLWKEKKFFLWFIYFFYGFFGGYTQDLKKPIISLLSTIILFSFIYLFMDYDINKALQRGAKGALPYLSIDIKKPFTGYWLILRNIEFILGSTFSSFFILSLRKRFKQ